MNILITSASRKVDLVKAFQKAATELGGGRIIAVDVNPSAPALYIADRAFLVRKSDDPLFLDQLLSLCHKEQVKLIVPTRDEELPVLAGAKAQFATAGVAVMVCEPEVIRICQDKFLFTDFCARHGFGVARTFDDITAIRSSNFPLFVRARVTNGSRSAFRVENEQQLRYVCERVFEPLIQEFIDAKEYTIDLFADFRGRVISVVPRERIAVVSGESFIGRTIKSPDLMDAAMALGRRLGLIGHNTIQCFFDGTTVNFIEVNPRYGGAAALGFAAGAFTPKFLLRLCRGEQVHSAVGDFRENLTMLRYTQDIFCTAECLARTKHLD